MSNFFELRNIQSQGAIDIISTLRTVEINAVDVCNRSCEFCPQSSDQFQITKGRISLSLITKIAKDLEEINFNGRITFTGFGEPLLYKDLVEAVSIFRSIVTNVKWIEIVTNGDYLTRGKIIELSQAGCTNITVSMYDCDMSSTFLPMAEGTNIDITLKHSYEGFLQVNRNEMLNKKIFLTKAEPCYLPFYKMVIDKDGSVLLCSNDWSRHLDLGNVNDTKIIDLWLGEKMDKYRKYLKDGARKNCNPCKFCDINGTKYGEESFNQWLTRFV